MFKDTRKAAIAIQSVKYTKVIMRRVSRSIRGNHSFMGMGQEETYDNPLDETDEGRETRRKDVLFIS